MKKDILFLCQYFYPEVNSSATLPYDTAEFFANNGRTVDVLCGYPKEYSQERGIPVREEKNNINIRRLRYIQLSRVGKIGRLINYFSFTFAVLLHILTFRNYHSVIVYSNPPILPVVPVLANRLFHTKYLFVAYDIYPEIAYTSGTLSPDGIISKVMRRINRDLYKRADSVIVLSDEMKQFVLKNRPEITEDRVNVISNWAHEKQNAVTKSAYERFGYSQGQFIVTYFGNMGICQDVETMLEAMRLLKDNTDVQFLIAGHGKKKKYVEDQVKMLPNVKVLDFLTGEEFEQASSISSCGIVSLEAGLKGTCAPSKYYSYLQTGQPVLAVVEEGSYLEEEIEGENIGYAVRIGEGKALAEAIVKLMSEPDDCAEKGRRAGEIYKTKYDRKIAFEKYDKLISGVL